MILQHYSFRMRRYPVPTAGRGPSMDVHGHVHCCHLQYWKFQYCSARRVDIIHFEAAARCMALLFRSCGRSKSLSGIWSRHHVEHGWASKTCAVENQCFRKYICEKSRFVLFVDFLTTVHRANDWVASAGELPKGILGGRNAL